ncbi:MAG: DUF2892 domain-containing protein [Ferruginibacter sp.]
MKSNLGNTDRTVRVILAVLIGAAGLYFKSWWGLLAIVPLVTALSSFCPVYKIFGLNTCSTKSVQ